MIAGILFSTGIVIAALFGMALILYVGFGVR
jgi:hypothetical protein